MPQEKMSLLMNNTISEQPRPRNNGTRQLFASPILEKLSRTHIAIPVSIFLAYATAILYWSTMHTSLSLGLTLLLFLIGMLVFTWVEYNVHRYVFHISTPTILTKRFQYTIHGVHHEFPKDKDRLAMPPLLSITIATLLLILCRLVMGDLAFAFMPGFFVGYACYLSVHYMVHAYAPPKGWRRTLWTNHAIHHYKDGACVFGVSSPLWDYIYGTMPGKAVKD
jgi:sterol desaturase/sphingolipid hydroxylase (fatty acid hydroxylase superfamily)